MFLLLYLYRDEKIYIVLEIGKRMDETFGYGAIRTSREKEITDLEKTIGYSIVPEAKDPYATSRGEWRRLLFMSGGSATGVYRGLFENGHHAMLPYVDYAFLPGPRGEQILTAITIETETPAQIRSDVVIGISPVNEEHIKKILALSPEREISLFDYSI